MVSDLRSCTMLSTLPLFYIAQSVNSDDRRTRIQGLRVVMQILGGVKKNCTFASDLTWSKIMVNR